jgi:ketosteroid isomerase-like protein
LNEHIINGGNMFVRGLTLMGFVMLSLSIGHFAGAKDMKGDLEKTLSEFDKAFNAKDQKALEKVYTKDAKFIPPNHQIASGNEAVATALMGAVNGGGHEHKFEIIDMGGTGKETWATVKWTAKWKGKDGKDSDINGIAFLVLEKEKEGMKIKVHGYN